MDQPFQTYNQFTSHDDTCLDERSSFQALVKRPDLWAFPAEPLGLGQLQAPWETGCRGG